MISNRLAAGLCVDRQRLWLQRAGSICRFEKRRGGFSGRLPRTIAGQSRRLFHFPTAIHRGCTSCAPCHTGRRDLPSFGASKRARLSAHFTEANRTGRMGRLAEQPKPAPVAPSTRIPQRFSGNFAGPGCNTAETRSICDANTISCALYLTHPTEGGTFTTASQIASNESIG